MVIRMFRTPNSISAAHLKQSDHCSAFTKLLRGAGPMTKSNRKAPIPSRRPHLSYFGRWVLAPHQNRAVEYFLRRGRRMILGDGWNMGKTVTSLACMHSSKCKKVLVLVPKILIEHWLWHVQQIGCCFVRDRAGFEGSPAGAGWLSTKIEKLVRKYEKNLSI
jgi:hypothetical protein